MFEIFCSDCLDRHTQDFDHTISSLKLFFKKINLLVSEENQNI